MSKVSFRAKQIDFNKPLPILRNAADLLSEFNENALVIRGVPQIPSGMEKEEENEHHFVEVINALQSGSEAAVKIPVPDIIDCTESYKNYYPEDFLLSKQLVHIRIIRKDADTTALHVETWVGIAVLSEILFSDILSRLVGRETVKGAVIHTDYKIFQSRSCMNDWDGSHLAESESIVNKAHSPSESSFEVSPKVSPVHNKVLTLQVVARKRSCHKRKICKRGGTLPSSSTNVKETLSEPKHLENPYAFVRTPGCHYLKPRFGTFDGYLPLLPKSRSLLAYERQPLGTAHHPFQYSFTAVPSVCHSRRRIHCGYVRRRLGRGGRVIYDRSHPPDSSFEVTRDYCHSTSISNELGSNSTIQSWTTDDTLLRRLSTVILSSHRGRPSFKWPQCPKRPSTPSFVPLQPPPLPCSGDSINDKQPIPVTKSEILSTLSKTYSSSAQSDSQFEPMDRLQSCDSQVNVTIQSSDKKTIPPAIQSQESTGTPGYQQPVLSLTDIKLPAAPFQIWRKFSRPYQPEVQLAAANGVGSRLFKSSDNGLLRKEPPLLNPPKMRCLPRDCVKRDVNVPVRQITTANGVGKTAVFELPT